MTNICSDKTGTLTEGKMAARSLFLTAAGTMLRVTGSGQVPVGELEMDRRVWVGPEGQEGLPEAAGAVVPRAPLPPAVLPALECAVLNSNAQVQAGEEQGKWEVSGDQTEASVA